MPSGLPLVLFHTASVVEPRGLSKLPASVRDRLSEQERKALVESLSPPPSRAGGDASSRREHWALVFSYRWGLAVPEPPL